MSDLAGRLLSFLVFIWVARQLPPAQFGWYLYGLSTGFVLAQLADLGLHLVVSREIAVHDHHVQLLVPAALRLKMLLSVIVLFILLLLASTAEPVARPPIVILGLAQLLQTYLDFAGHIFRGQQRLQREAWYIFLARLLLTLFVWTAVTINISLISLSGAHLLAMVVIITIVFRRLNSEGWLRPAPPRSRPPSRALLRTAAPLGLAIFASIAYTRLAILLLQPLAGETAVAQFGAAMRLIEPLQLIPAALMAAVFPLYSSAWYGDRSAARRLGWLVSVFLAISAVLLAIILFFVAPLLIPWLLGAEFTPAIPIARLLGLTIVPAFINYSLTHYLIARDQQSWITLLNVGMLLLHLGLCLGLIPRWGTWVPAVTMLIAESFLFAGCLFVLRFRPVPVAKESLRGDMGNATGILGRVNQSAFPD